MSLADEYLLGNPILHHQFCQATEILAVLVSQAPHPVGMAALERFTRCTAKELAPLCSSLWQTMLITPNADGEGWVLIAPAHRLTLEDVFRCVVERQKARPPKPLLRLRPDVDTFVSQATITINQSVFRMLRQFPLSRLRFDGSGSSGFNPHFLSTTGYDAQSEPVSFDDIILTSPLS